MTSGIQRFDWRSLIAPFRPIFGTPRSDTLSALAEGDVVFGFGGDDELSSTFNRTALLGGRGQDTLTTNVTPVPVAPLHMLAVQLGGKGNDTLQASLIPQGFVGGQGDVTAALFLAGGDGHDVITARIDFETAIPVSATTLILGGRGNDTIDVEAGHSTFDFPRGSGTTVNTIHGGDGDDHITALARDFGAERPPASARNVITGGNGNDIIDATAHAANLDAQLVQASGGVDPFVVCHAARGFPV
jgi:serralysin